MVTAQDVFDIAIHLMDEQDETTGATTTTDTREYKLRAIPIMNSIIPGLYPFSSTYDPTIGFYEPLVMEDYRDPDLSQPIPLDDSLSLAVLPYYLAAQLLSVENESLASWMKNQGAMAFNDLRNRVPASFEKIDTPYGF